MSETQESQETETVELELEDSNYEFVGQRVVSG